MTRHHRTTRRTLLAAGALLAVPASGRAAVDTDTIRFRLDAELLTLGTELDRLWAVERQIAGIDPEREETREEAATFEAARDETEKVVRRIAALDAKALAGLKVQARACAWLDDDDYWAVGVEEYEYRLRQKVVAGILTLV